LKKLTAYQRRLRNDIGYVSYIGKMDPDDLPAETDWHTTHLEHVRDKMVRGEVLSQYILIDQWLTIVISMYYFKKAGGRQKKLKLFRQHIMDEMHVLQKMRLVHAIAPLPATVRQNIERINAVRNSVSHSLFPEDRRQYTQHRKVMYRDTHLFGMKGMEQFARDVSEVLKQLQRRAMGARLFAQKPADLP
jgi:hypothetical protein